MNRNRTLSQSIEETPITFLILVANLTMFGLTWQEKGQLEDLGAEFANQLAMLKLGAQHGVLLQDGELWRMLSGVFLHHNLLHIGFNCFALWQLGPPIERELGLLRYSILYLVSGLCGSLVAGLFYGGDGLLAGASGAIFGLLGALLAIAMRNRRSSRFASEVVAVKRLVGTIAAYLVLGFLIPFISGWAHLGGFLGGFALLTCFFFRPFQKADRSAWILRGSLLALVLAMTARVMHPIEDPYYQWLRYEAAKTPEARQSWARAITDSQARGVLLNQWTIELLDDLGPEGERALERRGLSR